MTEEREWYVVARDAEEADNHVEVFGPMTEIDAKAYALDLHNDDDGWESIVAMQMLHKEAEQMSTDGRVMWPYGDEE